MRRTKSVDVRRLRGHARRSTPRAARSPSARPGRHRRAPTGRSREPCGCRAPELAEPADGARRRCRTSSRGGRLRAGPRWTAPALPNRHRAGPEFRDVVVDERTDRPEFTHGNLEPGRYYWRVAAPRRGIDGPFAEPRAFEIVRDADPPPLRSSSRRPGVRRGPRAPGDHRAGRQVFVGGAGRRRRVRRFEARGRLHRGVEHDRRRGRRCRRQHRLPVRSRQRETRRVRGMP